MRIFLTGSTGKIGSVAQRIFAENDHEVVSFDISDGGDIMDAAAVREAMEGCDGVVHLAMRMGREYAPEAVYASGTVGTWNVLAAAEACGAQRVVSFSSVNAMGIFMGEGAPDFLPIDESHPCRPGRPYGISKYLGEQTCRLFTHRTGVATICIRPPAVWTEEDIAWVKESREKDAEFEWTPYWEYGCFIHVEDLARATLCALTCPDPGHIALLVNADDISSTELTSRELVQKLLPDIEWRGGPEYEREPYKALMDNSRAREVLDWAPQYRWRG
jgi:nucleoside-diphosphate-sugar epimerase